MDRVHVKDLTIDERVVTCECKPSHIHFINSLVMHALLKVKLEIRRVKIQNSVGQNQQLPYVIIGLCWHIGDPCVNGHSILIA